MLFSHLLSDLPSLYRHSRASLDVKCKTEFLSFASTQLEIPFTIMKIAEILAFRTLCLLVLIRTTLHNHETHAINIMAKLIFICKIISSLAIEKTDRGS